MYRLAFGVVNALTEVRDAVSLDHLETQGPLWQLFLVEAIPTAPEAGAQHTSTRRREFLVLKCHCCVSGMSILRTAILLLVI